MSDLDTDKYKGCIAEAKVQLFVLVEVFTEVKIELDCIIT